MPGREDEPETDSATGSISASTSAHLDMSDSLSILSVGVASAGWRPLLLYDPHRGCKWIYQIMTPTEPVWDFQPLRSAPWSWPVAPGSRAPCLIRLRLLTGLPRRRGEAMRRFLQGQGVASPPHPGGSDGRVPAVRAGRSGQGAPHAGRALEAGPACGVGAVVDPPVANPCVLTPSRSKLP